MSGYTPIFRSVFQGSLCGKFPDLPLWLVILAMADKNGEVDAHPAFIASVSGIPVEQVTACIERFCQPDSESRSKSDEGRRLIPIEGRGFGWRVVNHAHYREKARLMAKNAREVEEGKNAERMKDRRRPPETAGDPLSNANANSDSRRLRSSSVGDLSPSYSERAPRTVLKNRQEENRKALRSAMAGAVGTVPRG